MPPFITCQRPSITIHTFALQSASICASSVQSTGGDGDKPYFISKIAGNGAGNLKVNVPALEATFGIIYGVVQSKNGDLYAVAYTNQVVLKLEFNKQEGTWTNVEVIAGTGSSGKGADDIVGAESALRFPTGLSLIEDDSTGEVTAILIADSGNHRIRKLDMSTRIITTIAGTGKSGFSGDGSPAKEAKLTYPRNVYYDKSTGDIYIVDTNNHRIRRVRDGIITTVAGKTCTGSDGLGDGEQATDACLKDPYFFTMNGAGEWFIVDQSHNRIRKVDSTGTITTVAGGGTETGDAVATSVKLNNPQSVAFTSSGEMLVADYGKKAIRKMDTSGFMTVIAGSGSKSPSSDNPIPAKSSSIQPRVVAYARDGIVIGDDRGYVFMVSHRTKCYSIWSDNSTVCSGRGTCMGPDECECEDGWAGHDCSIAYCFDITSNETSVCSGHGSCIAPDRCQCDSGWMEDECSMTQCFDTMSNETSACSGHGICMGPDACECDDGWSGTNCSVMTECFDIKANDKSVCSAHGSCIGEDQCQCDDGWMGVDCSITHCFGFTSNHPDVCSGKGKCVKSDECHCNMGHRGHHCQRI